MVIIAENWVGCCLMRVVVYARFTCPITTSWRPDLFAPVSNNTHCPGEAAGLCHQINIPKSREPVPPVVYSTVGERILAAV